MNMMVITKETMLAFLKATSNVDLVRAITTTCRPPRRKKRPRPSGRTACTTRRASRGRLSTGRFFSTRRWWCCKPKAGLQLRIAHSAQFEKALSHGNAELA